MLLSTVNTDTHTAKIQRGSWSVCPPTIIRFRSAVSPVGTVAAAGAAGAIASLAPALELLFFVEDEVEAFATTLEEVEDALLCGASFSPFGALLFAALAEAVSGALSVGVRLPGSGVSSSSFSSGSV